MFFLGITESLTGVRVTDALYTVSTYIFNDHYYRMGFLRATTTLSMPNYFSNVCLFVAPLIFYLHKVTNHKRYLLYSLLNILALIHAGSRASMVFYIGVWILYLAFNVLNTVPSEVVINPVAFNPYLRSTSSAFTNIRPSSKVINIPFSICK